MATPASGAVRSPAPPDDAWPPTSPLSTSQPPMPELPTPDLPASDLPALDLPESALLAPDRSPSPLPTAQPRKRPARWLRQWWLSLGPATRLAAGLVVVVIAAIVVAESFVDGFLDSPHERAARERTLVARLASAQAATALSAARPESLAETWSTLRQQHRVVEAIALVRPPEPTITVGDLAGTGNVPAPPGPANGAAAGDRIHLALPIGGHPGVELRLVFAGASDGFVLAGVPPAAAGLAVMALLGFISFRLYLRRAMRYLDPAGAMPDGVRTAFDALVEGVIVIDRVGTVMLTNRALEALHGETGPPVAGRHIDSFGWLVAPFVDAGRTPPWHKVLKGRGASLGRKVGIVDGQGKARTVVLNCTPVDNGQDAVLGCLLTLTDVTELEERTLKLRLALDELSESRDLIVRRNAELTRLATRDALTGVLNRGTLMVEADQRFHRSRSRGEPLVCLMCDIDHFKRVNDQFGHAAGDRVIQSVASELEQALGERGIVGRYGGEEFCILLSGQTLDQALHFADYLRARIEANTTGAISADEARVVTISLGAAVREATAGSSAELIDRADQALYHAKRSGRNRVAAWPPPAQ